jgi:DNA-directed RNA polymerase beta' subunit
MSFQLKMREEAGSSDSSANSAAATPETVTSIVMSLWNPKDIIDGSVVQVSSTDTYENNLPKPQGLFDQRMGVIENGQVCETCKQNNHNCTGHFGHIELAKPVYFVQLQSMVLKVLRCVCWRCSKCLLTPEEQKAPEIRKTKGKARFNTVVEICQKNSNKKGLKAIYSCSECNAVQPKYCLDKDKKSGGGIANVFYARASKPKELTKLSIENVLLILKRITDGDVEMLGLSAKYSRPDWMICVVLPVPPPHVRPSVRQDGNQKAEDDLTHKLSDIIKTNKTLQEKISAPAAALTEELEASKKKNIEECHGLLQYHVATFMDNEIVGLPQANQRGSGRALKALRQRLSAKEGRMRNNLMGKRCNFTARSVISPDANLALDELGVPMSIATNLTFPVIVTKLNIQELNMYVRNGTKHPGAKSVVKGVNGRRYCLAYATPQLEYGDTVNRHMIDGDVVLFNRQPSLHKMSMMGHRVRVLPVGMTFRLNLSVTTPYNADFDGDEMNAHLPQTYQTMAELKYLTLVPSQLISPQKNAPVMGIVQDALLAGNLMTKAGSIMLNQRDVCRLLMWNNDFGGILPALEPGRTAWTGQQLFAGILPQIINLSRKKDDVETHIRSNQQMSGTLDKSILGNAGGGLIHILYKDYSDQHSADFMYKAQQLFNNWLLINGFSVGMADCKMPQHAVQAGGPTIPQQVSQFIEDTKEKVLTLLQNSYDHPDTTPSDELEIFIKRDLADGREKVGELIRKNTTHNRLLDMIKAESKGSPMNLSQISGCFGQSEVEGNRIPLTMDRRTLPFYAKDDDSAESRGFISQSLLKGLTPQQYYFYAMAGRIGIIDTAVKTAETGYIQRRLIKTMEDISVRPDHTVRDATGNIVEFQYGEDGFDACRLEAVSADFHTVSAKVFHDRFAHQYGDALYWETYLASIDDITIDVGCLKAEYAYLVQLKEEFRANISVFQDKVYCPIQLSRVIENVLATHSDNKVGTFTTLSPCTTYMLVSAQIDKMKQMLLTNAASAVSQDRATHSMYILEAIMRTLLSSKQVMTHWKLTHQGLQMVLHECYKMFLRGLVNPGEMVGIIASQSIGEPATQMCVDGTEVVTVWNKTTRQCYHGPIGPWMDGLLHDKAATNVQLGERFVANNLLEDELYIHAVSMSSEKMPRPFRIRQISRLPANGAMMKITTRTGRTVTATMSHAFLRRLTSGMEKVSGHALRVGDRIPVAGHLPVFDDEEGSAATAAAVADPELLPLPLNELLGSLVGLFLSGGHLDENSTKVTLRNVPMAVAINTVDLLGAAVTPLLAPNDSGLLHVLIIDYPGLAQWLRAETGFGSRTGTFQRRVPQCMFAAPLPCVAALLRCYLDGDGNIAAEKHTIRCCSTSAALLDDISLLLGYFDILPYKFKSAAGSLRLHHMAICTKYADAYVARIGSNVESKLAALRAIVAYNGRSDCKSRMEFMDKIPKLGPLLTQMCKRAGFNRSCQQWATRESIGRRTLLKYIELFEAQGSAVDSANVEILRQAHDSDVVWDKIMHIEIIPEDTTKLVYDLSVEDAETFMLGSGVLVHNTLNTFHFSGVSAKSQTTTGVPRLKELLNISKHPKTPSMTVFLDPLFSASDNSANRVGNLIAMVTVKDILSSSFLQLYNKKTTVPAAAADAQLLHRLIQSSKTSKMEDEMFVICLKFDRGMMYQKQLYMDAIETKLSAYMVLKKEQGVVICSDDNLDDNEPMAVLAYSITTDNVGKIRKAYKKVGEIPIGGMPNISSYDALSLKTAGSGSITKDKSVKYAEDDEGKYVKSNDEYLLQTVGSNLAAILNLPEIDATRSVSNNVNEIYELFGIEAARQALIEEFTETLSRTAYVNYRHVCLLSDVMTNKGILLSIDIHGVKKGDIGPLARASFEETVDQLVKSACFAEKDKMTGVSANIMLGQVPPTGTGTVQLLFDERKIAFAAPAEQQQQQQAAEKKATPCDAINFGFNFVPLTTSSTLLPIDTLQQHYM